MFYKTFNIFTLLSDVSNQNITSCGCPNIYSNSNITCTTSILNTCSISLPSTISNTIPFYIIILIILFSLIIIMIIILSITYFVIRHKNKNDYHRLE